jgi:protoporphyrinogen/coproporphyrinogen III oxidase
VQSVHRLAHGWQVRAAGNSFDCRHLVSALPVNLSLPLLSAALPAPPPLSAIPEARIATVVLGFDHRADIPSGFGYLAPESEGRFTLGALFSSNMFPGRAPEGFQLMEALVGGRRHPERLELDDDRLIGAVCQDLRQLMSLPPSPGFSTVLRTESGIPQPEEGFTELLAWRRRLEESEPCLHVCGFGWKGIGINDMTKEAWRIARRIGAEHPIAEGSDVKGIYF